MLIFYVFLLNFSFGLIVLDEIWMEEIASFGFFRLQILFILIDMIIKFLFY